ncbi:MAG: hypothetical protein V7641_5603 [Blastocatellia bacterium]
MRCTANEPTQRCTDVIASGGLYGELARRFVGIMPTLRKAIECHTCRLMVVGSSIVQREPAEQAAACSPVLTHGATCAQQEASPWNGRQRVKLCRPVHGLETSSRHGFPALRFAPHWATCCRPLRGLWLGAYFQGASGSIPNDCLAVTASRFSVALQESLNSLAPSS